VGKLGLLIGCIGTVHPNVLVGNSDLRRAYWFGDVTHRSVCFLLSCATITAESLENPPASFLPLF
jgi:hypothetical protein